MKWVIGFCFASLTQICFGNTKDFREKNFFIKPTYISRDCYTHFDDTPLKDEFQDEVYFAAHQLANTYLFNKIGDIGCGSGYKLLKYFAYQDTVGFEIEPTLSYLRSTYPHKNWSESDFSLPFEQSVFDVLICSDVIEHLTNPDDLLNWIDQIDFKYLVISTPDREQLIHTFPDNIPQTQSGPPVNKAHVREWSFREFEAYIGQYFDVIEHFHPEREFIGQIIIAAKKSL